MKTKLGAGLLLVCTVALSFSGATCGGDDDDDVTNTGLNTGTGTGTGSGGGGQAQGGGGNNSQGGGGAGADCNNFDYCVDDMGNTVSGCGDTCGGITHVDCPINDLVCVNQPFLMYDGGAICVPPHALTCTISSDCQCLPSLGGCSWEQTSTRWNCKSGKCMAECYTPGATGTGTGTGTGIATGTATNTGA